jgi:hypothetical protein
MPPSGGEGKMGGSRFASGEHVSQEQLQRKNPEFFKNRPDAPMSFAAPGDDFKLGGDAAVVLHEEKNSDGTTDVTVQRSVRGNSGTYIAKTEPAAGRKRVVTKVKRSFD